MLLVACRMVAGFHYIFFEKFGVCEVRCDVAKYLLLRTCMFTYSRLDCAETPDITCCLCERVIMLQSGFVK